MVAELFGQGANKEMKAHLVRAGILLLAFSSVTSAQRARPRPVVIHESNGTENGGKIVYGGNELLNDSKVEDPPAVRLGAPAGLSLGKFSFDLITGAGDQSGRREKVVIIGKVAPDGAGYIEFFGQLPGTDDDKGMVRLLTLHPTEGVTFYGPIRVDSRPGEPAKEPDRFPSLTPLSDVRSLRPLAEPAPK
jgi:hypothetical protein